MTDRELIQKAIEARERAYAPYSHFTVGAALLSKSGIYTGCNIENASYPATNCAERTAFFQAVANGEKEFLKIAIVGGKMGERPAELCPPCGICRQVMREFCGQDFQIILAKTPEEYLVYTLEELLPHSFGNTTLKGEGSHEKG